MNLAVILFDKNCKVLNKKKINDYNYYLKIISKDKKLYFIDLTKFYFGKLNSELFEFKNDRIEYIKIESIEQLETLKKKNGPFYAIGPIQCTLNTFVIFVLLKIYQFKLIFINFFGFYLNTYETDKKFYLKNLKVFMVRVQYLFFRFLSILNIIPKIEYCFEASNIRIKNIENSLSKRLEKKFNFLKLSYFKKCIRINSIYHDEIELSENEIKEDYLMLLDSGFDHPDYLKFGSINDKKLIIKNRKNYYENLFNFLNRAEKFYKKKVVYSIHPKSFYPEEIIEYIKTKYILKSADKAIYAAQTVFFTGGSSMINKCLALKKNFYFLTSRYNNSYVVSLINSLQNSLLDLPKINLEEFENFNDISNYNYNGNIAKDFIKNSIVFDENKSSNVIISKTLYKN